jgi:hypothetical protein
LSLSQSAISKTLKRKAQIIQRAETTDFRPDAKKHRGVKYPLMEDALARWILANENRINLSGEIIQEKGKHFLRALYGDSTCFDFSNGWFERLKARHRIRSFRRFGESGSVDPATIESSLPRIQAVTAQFAAADIYNMDETGLFYRMQADNSLAKKQLEGRKQSKERITVALCANASGSDKLPLWILEKYANPRCFKNINRNALGCRYTSNRHAWMTQSIFFSNG